VAGNFLRNWFGGSKSPPSVEEARAELDRVGADRPALRPLFGWLRELLPDLAPDLGATPAPTLTPDQARQKLAEGVPLLRGERLALDVKAFRRRWQRACEALETAQPDGAAPPLADALRRGRLEPGEMVEAVLAGRPEDVRDRSAALGLDPGLTTTLLRYVLFPTFAALEVALEPLRQGAAWENGCCPTCGSWPLLGEFRGLEQTRWLRCGLCAAGWEVRRLWCPFCGCRDHERLRFLHGEGEEERCKAAVCDACRGYVKMIATLSAIPPLHLLIADVATLHLDLAAAERGCTNQP
jgi:FdhE protein